jgi:hypothetical protein
MNLHRLRVADRYAARLAETPQKQKAAVLAEGAAELGVSVKTFYRLLARVTVRERKKRGDHGQYELTRAEADVLSGYLMEGYRLNDKRGRTLETAVDVLRANGQIRAERVDPATGEIRPLSYSAISRALHGYGVHPEQLRRPTPHQKLKSLHPNHVWQVDGSVCVLYYLPGGGAVIEELDPAVHYKNKAHNLKAIEEKRVIRYVLTDHTTNVIRWRYYPHAESAEHTVRFLAWAMAPKADPTRDPFHGRPRILMVDPGATAGGLVKRFCRRLGIELIVNQRRKPRAKGSVENGQDRVEMAFEHGLRDCRSKIRSFEDLNRAAETFQLWWNATKTHTRHGLTRFGAWLHIREEQFVITGPEATLLSLATDEPIKRRVTGNLTVDFKSRTWDVSEVPGVMVGGSVYVHWHPFRAGTAMAVVEDADGRELHIELPDVTGTVDPANGEWGWQKNAAVIGEEFKSLGDTETDRNRKRVRLVASGEQTLEADEKARSRKDFEAYGGRINPYREAEEAELPPYLPKRGRELGIAAPTVALIPLTHIEAAKWLKSRLDREWVPANLALIQKRYPDGVPEADLEELLAELRAVTEPVQKPALKVVKQGVL